MRSRACRRVRMRRSYKRCTASCSQSPSIKSSCPSHASVPSRPSRSSIMPWMSRTTSMASWTRTRIPCLTSSSRCLTRRSRPFSRQCWMRVLLPMPLCLHRQLVGHRGRVPATRSPRSGHSSRRPSLRSWTRCDPPRCTIFDASSPMTPRWPGKSSRKTCSVNCVPVVCSRRSGSAALGFLAAGLSPTLSSATICWCRPSTGP